MPPRRRHIPVAETQEFFTFTEARRMPADYDGYVALAAEATRMRHKRKNALAMSLRTQGYRRVTKAFIPRSGGEHSAIIKNPQTKLKGEVFFAKQRVHDKYAETDVNPKRVKQWALFSAGEVAAKGRAKYRNYRIDALMQLAHLGDAIQGDGTVTYDNIMGSQEATTELKNYLVDLKIFVGDAAVNKKVIEGDPDTPPKRAKRRWIARNHTRRRAAETAWAEDYMTHLRTTDIENLFVEALGNAWSRNAFWYHAEEEFKAREKQIQETEPVWAYPPDEVYNDTPDAQGVYEEALGRIVLEDL